MGAFLGSGRDNRRDQNNATLPAEVREQPLHTSAEPSHAASSVVEGLQAEQHFSALQAYASRGLYSRVNTARITVALRCNGSATATVAVANEADLADAKAQADWMGVSTDQIMFVIRQSIPPAGYVTPHTVAIAMQEASCGLAYTLCALELHRCLREVTVEYWSACAAAPAEGAGLSSNFASAPTLDGAHGTAFASVPTAEVGAASGAQSRAAATSKNCAVVLMRARVSPEHYASAAAVVKRIMEQLGTRVRVEAVAGAETLLVLPPPGFGRVTLDPFPDEPPRMDMFVDWTSAFVEDTDGRTHREFEVNDVFDQSKSTSDDSRAQSRAKQPSKDRKVNSGSCTLSAYVQHNGVLYAVTTAHKMPPPGDLHTSDRQVYMKSSPRHSHPADAGHSCGSGVASSGCATIGSAAGAISADTLTDGTSPTSAGAPFADVSSADAPISDSLFDDCPLKMLCGANPSSITVDSLFEGAYYAGAMPHAGATAEPTIADNRVCLADVSIFEVSNKKLVEMTDFESIPLLTKLCGTRPCLPAWADYCGAVQFYGRPCQKESPRTLQVVGYAVKKVHLFSGGSLVETELVNYIAVHTGSGDEVKKGDSGGPVFKSGSGTLHSFIRAEACTFVGDGSSKIVDQSYAMLTPAHFALQQGRTLLCAAKLGADVDGVAFLSPRSVETSSILTAADRDLLSTAADACAAAEREAEE
jgi:hypothetical protein